ncbi:MAG: hypothetical protein AAF610_04815 [Pseudomonadota bacterium]
MLEPFFLAGDGPDLLLTYHPPGGDVSDEITLICAPFFGEYHRTHLALRELAISLSAAGQHVIRFDYRGCGDAFGQVHSLGDWQADLHRAIAEARAISGCHVINVVAVRAATLLLPVHLDEVSRVVLWDPVWQGQPYLTGYLDLRDRSVFRNRWLTRAARASIKDELFGFPLPAALSRDIHAADVREAFACSNLPVTSVVTRSDGGAPPGVTKRRVTFACNWLTRSDDVLLPRPVLEELHECVLNR